MLCDSFTLHASGREDLDVRMLGTGRPFIIELKNCKKSLEFDDSCELLIN